MVALNEQTLLSHLSRIVPLTTDQYHEMIRNGILPESSSIELLDGMLIRKDRSKKGADPMSIGEEHRWCVEQLHDINVQLKTLGAFIQTQQPVELGAIHEPEPDGSIVRGSNSDYRQKKPNSADVLCVIEVADSSLDYDRTSKLQAYAGSNIPQYVIINLVDRQIEIHRRPDPSIKAYQVSEVIKKDGQVKFNLDGDRSLVVAASHFIQ